MPAKQNRSDLPIQTHCCPCCNHCADRCKRNLPPRIPGWHERCRTRQSPSSPGSRGRPWVPPRRTTSRPRSVANLVVKPVLVYSIPKRRPQTSWRNWGGIETQQQADEEVARIQGELDKLQAAADFPVKFLPLAKIQSGGRTGRPWPTWPSADVMLVYAAGGWMDTFNAIGKLGKDMIFFCRHKSGTGLSLVRDHQPALPAAAHRYLGGQGHRRRRRGDRQPGRIAVAAAGAVRAAQHRRHADRLTIGGPGAWATAPRRRSRS